MISANTMASERGLRKQIVRGLTKDVHPYTKPSMDFISKVLNDAVDQGMVFDVTDMWDDILQFAMSSNNSKAACMQIALQLPLKSEQAIEAEEVAEEAPLTYFDLEVYPNLVMVGYMLDDSDIVTTMSNPTPKQVEDLLTMFKLMGYFNRGYDNHILWALTLGWSNQEIFDLSQRIIVENDRRAGFAAAYNCTYGDIYDLLSAANKKSLKKHEIELGLPHMEMDLPWDEPVPEERIEDVRKYLENDVRSTKAVAHAYAGDIKAREILAELSGLQVINTNRQHTEAMIFGSESPDGHLVYTDLTEMFPGYEFDRFAVGKDKSFYKGQKIGEGGWVDAEEGHWRNVAVLDVASMHPSSIIAMNTFGKFTPNFKKLMDIRLALKRGDYDTAIDLDSRLLPLLADKSNAKALSEALKTVINSVYGLTAASFPNKFKDDRNVDNIVAKRGALFMVDVKEFVEQAGFKVVHVKTDSIKIPDATPEIIQQVMEFGEKYGYTFEHEDTYDHFVLFNDAVYIARSDGQWSATGKQFQHPVVFKTLLSQEVIEPADYIEVKQVVKGAMYLVTVENEIRTFVGKFGAFVPVLDGRQLVRIDGEKIAAVADTKGFLWELDTLAGGRDVDMMYFQEKVDEAMRAIEKYVKYEELMA